MMYLIKKCQRKYIEICIKEDIPKILKDKGFKNINVTHIMKNEVSAFEITATPDWINKCRSGKDIFHLIHPSGFDFNEKTYMPKGQTATFKQMMELLIWIHRTLLESISCDIDLFFQGKESYNYLKRKVKI